MPGTNYTVDGFIEEDGKIIEVLGCYWHQHRCKFDVNSMMQGIPAPEIWRRDQQRRKEIEDRGFEVECVYECQILDMLRQSKKMRKFFSKSEIQVNACGPHSILQTPLNVQDAFFGGRTEGFTLYHKVKKDENSSYVDFCSVSSCCTESLSSVIPNSQEIRCSSDW